ncbi:BON domain-containing protein [Pandoraea terrae]|nr:BON domain-containing protein [Pandoraea terrae]
MDYLLVHEDGDAETTGGHLDTLAGQHTPAKRGGRAGGSPPAGAGTRQMQASMPRQPFDPHRIEWPEGTVGATSGTGSRSVTDERLHVEVCERLACALDVDISDVAVRVANGVAVLEGSVPEPWMRNVAESVIADAEGLVRIDNRLHERKHVPVSGPGESQAGHEI